MKKGIEIALHVFFWVLTTWVIYLAFGEAEYELINENGQVTTKVTRNLKDVWYFSLNNLSKALLVYVNIFWLFPQYIKNRLLGRYIGTLLALVTLTLIIEQLVSNWWLFNPDAFWVFESPRLFFNSALALFYLGTSFAYCFARGWMLNEQQKSALVQEKLSTELAFLKAQVNPHFLFNTLNNLYSMASKTDSPELADGIERLSQLMRYMLYDSNSETVPLDKELDYIKSFIEIQKLRLAEEDDFVLQFSVEGDTKAVRIAPMLLIPFVENAFKHGIDFKESSVIKIELMIENEELIFSVFNSCPNIGTAMEKGHYDPVHNSWPEVEGLKAVALSVGNRNAVFSIFEYDGDGRLALYLNNGAWLQNRTPFPGLSERRKPGISVGADGAVAVIDVEGSTVYRAHFPTHDQCIKMAGPNNSRNHKYTLVSVASASDIILVDDHNLIWQELGEFHAKITKPQQAVARDARLVAEDIPGTIIEFEHGDLDTGFMIVKNGENNDVYQLIPQYEADELGLKTESQSETCGESD